MSIKIYLPSGVSLSRAITCVLTSVLATTHYGLIETECAWAAPVSKAMALGMRASKERYSDKQLDKALRHINQALSIEPNNARLLVIKSDILERLQEDEEALACSNRAVKLAPKDAQAWSIQADVLLRMHHNPSALDSANQAVKLSSQIPFRLARGRILFEMGRFADSERDYDAVIEAGPDNMVALDERSKVCSREQKWDKVIADTTKVLKSVTKLSYQYCRTANRRAEAYLKSQQQGKAIADYKWAIKTFPESLDAHRGLINAYLLMGDQRAADEEKKVLKRLDGELIPM